MRTLSRLINNQGKADEFSMAIMMYSLLNGKQYESSHSFTYVFVVAARKYVLAIIEGITNNTNNNSSTTPINQTNNISRNETDSSRSIEDNNNTNNDNLDNRDIDNRDLDGNVDLLWAEEGVGVAARQGNHVIIVTQDINYRYRGECSKDYNLLEYVALIKKVPIKNSVSTTANAGRPNNGNFRYSNSHPQYLTHEQQLFSKIPIPILAGIHVPKYPGPQNDSVSWHHNAKDYGSYFVTLLCPWDTITGIPIHAPTWEGLNLWIQTSTSLDQFHEYRLLFLQRCRDAAYNSPEHRLATALFKDKSAHTIADYNCMQQHGPHTMNHSNEETNTIGTTSLLFLKYLLTYNMTCQSLNCSVNYT